MVELTLFEIHLEDAQFVATAPFARTTIADEDRRSRIPLLGAVVVGVALLVVGLWRRYGNRRLGNAP